MERAGRASKSAAPKNPSLAAEVVQTTVVAASSSSDLGHHLISASLVSGATAASWETLAVEGSTVGNAAVNFSGIVATGTAGLGIIQRRHTAALVVIGDEILSGKVRVGSLQSFHAMFVDQCVGEMPLTLPSSAVTSCKHPMNFDRVSCTLPPSTALIA